MLERIRRNQIEALMVLVALVTLYYGAQSLLGVLDARASYQEALATQREVKAEAAQYNLSELRAERDSLAAAAGTDVFPTREQVERRIDAIAALLDDPFIDLGPVVMGETSEQVEDSDIGASGGGTRTYQAIEMSLVLNGDVTDLLGVAERMLAAAPEATFRDVGLSLGTGAGPASLELRVLLFYGEA